MNKSSTSRQRGFTLLDVVMALALSAIITTVYQSQQIQSMAEEAIATGVGEHVLRAQSGVTTYIQQKFVELSNGSAIPGFVDPLNPTIAELKAANFLSSQFNNKTSTQQDIKVQLTKSNCPGSTCQVIGLIYVDGALVVSRTGSRPRLDLASTAVQAMKGAGGLSPFDNPAIIRGSGMSVPNPVSGQPFAVVGATTVMNLAFFNQFVRINDVRDPSLQGNLTANGDGKFNGKLDVTGKISTNSDLSVNGNAAVTGAISGSTISAKNGSTCNRVNLFGSTGLIEVKSSDCLRTVATIQDSSTTGVMALFDSASRTRINFNGGTGTAELSNPSGVAVATLSATSSGALSLRGSTGVEHLNLDAGSRSLTLKNSVGAQTIKLWGDAGAAEMSYAILNGSATSGNACGTEGMVLKDANSDGQLLVCKSSIWRRVGVESVNAGDSCVNPGAFARTWSNKAVVCVGSVWTLLTDRMSRFVQVASYGVRNEGYVDKPTCTGGTPYILLTPVDAVSDYSVTWPSLPRNRSFAEARDSGSQWYVRVKAKDSSNNEYDYGLQATATTYCQYSL